MNERARGAYLAGLQEVRQAATRAAGLTDLEKALAADKDSPLVWAALADGEVEEYQRTSDSKWLAQAKEAERQSELRSLDSGIGHRAAADLAAQDNRFEDAEAQLLRAVELEPANADNYRMLGDAYERAGAAYEALRSYRQAVELGPKDYKNEFTLGWFYRRQGRYKEAVEHLSNAVKLEPSYSRGRSLLAEAYTDTGQFAKAIETMKGLNPWTADANYQYGMILMYQSKDREAVPYLIRAVKQQSNEAYWAYLDIAYRRTGHLNESKQAAASGLNLAERHLVENPRDAQLRAILGYFCAQLGQKERAESETAQALKLGPRDLDVVQLAVWTDEMLGKREESLAVLRKSAPPEMLDDLKRWPEMADLTADSRFIELTAVNAEKKEK